MECKWEKSLNLERCSSRNYQNEITDVLLTNYKIKKLLNCPLIMLFLTIYIAKAKWYLNHMYIYSIYMNVQMVRPRSANFGVDMHIHNKISQLPIFSQIIHVRDLQFQGQTFRISLFCYGWCYNHKFWHTDKSTKDCQLLTNHQHF